MGTLIVGLLVAAALVLAARSLYKDKKAGKHLCGGDCGSCGVCPHGSGSCSGNCSGCQH